jgi:3'-phosphoadenosine 5'-phosphosulfate sulfotransferase (PAPS reductase)/FAD synthetase
MGARRVNHYRIEGPAVISFSGGRTSGYMLRQILDAHGGQLPPDVVVLFANTGKEMPETLDFVEACSVRWSVPITWLEFKRAPEPADRWRVVTHATASRDGEPFAELIKQKQYLPNPVRRFCTSELKIKAMHRYLRATFGWDAWTSVIGIRADEPRRLAKISVPNRDRDERIVPLGAAGVSAADVGAFWRAQPFDLALPNMNGKTMHGNCDLCFLKGFDQVVALIRENPARAVWWAKQEAAVASAGQFRGEGDRFRKDRPSYAQMGTFAAAQGELVAFDEPLADCACTD